MRLSSVALTAMGTGYNLVVWSDARSASGGASQITGSSSAPADGLVVVASISMFFAHT